ncbi:DoxX family protein [Aeromicrobium sp. NPDC092404]|uniref:DoxX family protein n=1 Tax=Aeromicrobium sp. NPDC092404 TaxID=3154976 RepID=UPI00344536C3
MNELDTAALILRLVLGVTLIAHGWNHGFGPGGLKGTAGWFESIGLRPAKVHAAVSSYLELAAGAALLVGFLVPLAAAAGIGIMTVAFVTVHRKNGFFIFREGEGYEYVMTMAFALTALAVLGGGQASLDHALDLDLDGVAIGLGAAAAGVLGAAGMLVTSWRPSRSSD